MNVVVPKPKETDALLAVQTQLIESEHIKVASSLKLDVALVPGN